jgi:hypothetical protein
MSVSRRGDSWRARYYGPDGRQRSKSFKRKADAERWEAQHRSQTAQGDWIDPPRGRVMFGEYALGWLDSRASIKPKTRQVQTTLLNRHVMPTWRTVRLDRITFEGLTRWVADLTGGGLGPSSVRRRANGRYGCARLIIAPTASATSMAATAWAMTSCGASLASIRAPITPWPR